MRVLMTAPEPMFAARGTPIAVMNRCRALCALGHEVDLVTYPMGEDVAVPGLRLVRVANVLRRSEIAVGPSAAKVPYDTVLLAKTVQLLRRGRYDVIHTNEETGPFGWWLHRWGKVKHLRDLHSNLALVLTNYGFGAGHPLTRFAGWLERRTLASATAVIAVYPHLVELCRAVDPTLRVHVVHNIPLDPPADPAATARIRAEWTADGSPLIVYTGTLEPYQGMATAVEAMAMVGRSPAGRLPRLLVAGGDDAQISSLRAVAATHGVEGQLVTLGKRPFAEIPAYLAAADVLISPRSLGTNTPLKVYSYLRAGRPIIATDIVSHTQVLDTESALLVVPTAQGLADGLRAVLADRGLAGRLAAGAAAASAAHFSPRAYLAGVAGAYADLGAPLPSEQELDEITVRLLES